MWTSVVTWVTPTSLFILVNVVIATIAIISRFTADKSRHHPYGGPALIRPPSFLERVKSFNFTPYNSNSYYYSNPDPGLGPSLDRPARTPSMLDRLKSITLNRSDSIRQPETLPPAAEAAEQSPEKTHHEHSVSRSKSESITQAPTTSLRRRLEKSLSEKLPWVSFTAAQGETGELVKEIERHRPATARAEIREPETKEGGCKCTLNSNCQSFRTFVSSTSSSNVEPIVLGLKNKCIFDIKLLSTMSERILVQARDPAKLSVDIQTSIEEHRLNDTWKLYQQHMQMEGFPRKSVVNKLLTAFAETLEIQWLEKAYDLVEQAFTEGKQNLLEKDPLIYLSFSLAKLGLPVPASTILRNLIKMEHLLPVAAWSAILAHMSQTGPGAYLAAELILEIGYLFQDGRVDPRKKCNAPLIAMKPNSTAFNIALAGCVLFGTTRKAEELLDMMPRIGVKVDTNLLMVMVHIHERNGRREELKKLQRHIDEAHYLSDVHFRQFYSCLLTCHLKFGDLESASNMVLDMLRKAKIAKNSVATATLACNTAENHIKPSSGQGSEKNFICQNDGLKDKISNAKSISYEDFVMDKKFLKLDIEAKEILRTLLTKLQLQVELVTTERGILQPTEAILVKLVRAFLEAGKIKDLAQFLIKAEREESPVSNDDSVLVHVINACISLGWLDQAHDLLDEMHLAGVRTGSSVYGSLLKAYCKTNRTGEVASLLRDARKAGIQLDSSCYDALINSRVLQNDNKGALRLFQEMKEAKIPRSGHQEFKRLVENSAENDEAGLMAKLLQEIKDGQRVDYGLHDWNNVIHFFCKKRLMQDAEKALKKMRSLGHCPNAQTFHSMVTGYAAIGGKYVEVTELWGEMKSIASASFLKFDQELLDSVLYTFVRGGFFARANEVVEVMEKDNMFIDKYKYRTLFLKYHRTLYKGKAPKFQTEGQLRKRESALAFKKWVGLY